MRNILRKFKWVVVGLLGVIGLVLLASSCDEDEGKVPLTPKGYALSIGLNKVDPVHYAGWNGELFGCEPDANDMRDIATSQGLTVDCLLTSQATREMVLDKLGNLAETLNPGDLLVMSYSGHGGQIPDWNGDETDDGLDETWCLYDGELLDDELYGAWMKFKAGVRILVFSDSCHSGTVLKMKKKDFENSSQDRVREFDLKWKNMRVPSKLDRARILSLSEMREAVKHREYLRKRVGELPLSVPRSSEGTATAPMTTDGNEVFVSRSVPPGISVNIYQQNRTFYDELGRAAPKENSPQVKASVILISGCEDPQTSADIGFNGLFTWMLKRVWNNGSFSGNHRKFYEDIRNLVKEENSEQWPFFYTIGQPDEAFIQQQPYKVTSD